MPFSLAAIPQPVLIGAPIAGVGLLAFVLWYELIHKKTPAAGSLAAPAAAPTPPGPPMGAAAPPTGGSLSIVNIPKPKAVLKPIVMPSLTTDQKIAFAAWGMQQTMMPAKFTNDPVGGMRHAAAAALAALASSPSSDLLARTISSLAVAPYTASPQIAAVVKKLKQVQTQLGLTSQQTFGSHSPVWGF